MSSDGSSTTSACGRFPRPAVAAAYGANSAEAIPYTVAVDSTSSKQLAETWGIGERVRVAR